MKPIIVRVIERSADGKTVIGVRQVFDAKENNYRDAIGEKPERYITDPESTGTLIVALPEATEGKLAGQ
jgi:hypothetical protein